ncbi:MAG: dTDP-4-amino-4,6-dideoxygalactose transaminase [Firmicutes bacterium HGW-Firmicutes-12]|nr:MAG: dTDP-4-amino-4,6-dideoxygalactose transaminase [Firmicutes bacterium HGW-Firmicutes-12]
MQIPFNQPYYTGQEIEYIQDALAKRTSGDGIYTQKAAELIEERIGCRRVLMTTSGTHALEMAANLLGLRPGDEVIMPSYTFPSTANSILMYGAKPVFADIDERTLTLDPDDVIRKLTPRVKAIFPVHYGGVACNMDRIMEIARCHKLLVVEDAAQGVNAKYHEKYLGTLGDMGCLSFHATKNYISGEGGALLVNTTNEAIWEKAKVIRQKGTDRERFLQGEVEQYSWVDWGSNYTPSDLLMALLSAQLEAMDEITALRKKIYDFYYEKLATFAKESLRIIKIPLGYDSNYHLFYIILSSSQERLRVQKGLKEKGIDAFTHFVPLHLSPMGQSLGGWVGQLPVTERVSAGLLRLPLYAGMTRPECEYVVKALLEILTKGN